MRYRREVLMATAIALPGAVSNSGQQFTQRPDFVASDGL